ncbi:hypothetical protein C1H46_007348 [Malus baccata]|uniref:WDR11 first beta-propeller domain-containing protein n=1 Tax=Malus baccata TaxID=106549 RepID=A0A540N7D0_MALBA|nr:hypothetical protein C1H46_007348 [Malus baccata]
MVDDLFEGLPPPSANPPPPAAAPKPILKSALKRPNPAESTPEETVPEKKKLRFKTTTDASEQQVIEAMQKIASHIKTPAKFSKASKLAIQLIQARSVKDETSDYFFAILEAAMESPTSCTEYDAAPEVLSCIRRDPFDSRHFCVVGLKGFLLSVTVLGETESDVIIKEFQIRTDSTELLKLERDMARGVSGNSSSASVVFPTYVVRFAFSLQWRHILFVTFPRELVVFDLQYETPLFSATLPRGCGEFLDVLPDPNYEFLYCAHLDGKLSTWRRKEGGQVHIMCSMEELMPSIGTSVPSPLVLALVISQSDSTLQNIGKLYSDVPHPPSPLSSPPSAGPRSPLYRALQLPHPPRRRRPAGPHHPP